MQTVSFGGWLGNWDILLNLIPYVGPAVYGTKKTVEYAKEKYDKPEKPTIRPGVIVVGPQNRETPEIETEPWYRHWMTYGLLAAGVVGAVWVTKTLIKK